jgi:hypothetical protein
MASDSMFQDVKEAARRRPFVVEDETDKPLSKGRPSKPLLGVLPLARLIPQDIHSVMDYVDALSAGSGALMTDDPRAKFASIALAASGAGVSLMTDYRLSAAKLIPIETHEAIDHLWGMTAIALPFVLGYWKTEPRVAITHVATGLGTIVASLLTDYRAYRGRGKR